MDATLAKQRPNVLLIMCDQLRLDALGCYGNRVVHTPNIDRLAREGVRLEHYFVQSPVCQPSRATLATGRYPRAHKVKANWYDLPSDETTLQAVLGKAGYRTCAVGKMHFEPLSELHGFDDRAFIEGKMFVADDEYRLYLDSIGAREKFQAHVATWDSDEDFGARPSPLDDNEYINTFIGAKALEKLTDLDEPFFAWVSFVNPHMPYDPPEPFASMYDPNDMSLPPDWPSRQDSRIPEHRTSSGKKDFGKVDEAEIRRIMTYYYGCVSLVDREIGKLLDLLTSKGILDNTLVIFTTDHGDFLGHRGLLWKGGRMLYDDLLRVPFIARYPSELPANEVVSDLCQATDVLPTVLDYAGVEVPAGVQGRSMRQVLCQGKVGPWRDTVFSEGQEVKMIRDHHWKLIFYPNRPYGELYNVKEDPTESRNLYFEEAYQRQRSIMIERLAARLIANEDPLPRASKRPGYFEASGFHSAQELGE